MFCCSGSGCTLVIECLKKRKNKKISAWENFKKCSAECHNLANIKHSVIMLNVIVVNVVAPLKVSLSERLIRQEGLQQNKKKILNFFF
jgi:hypothetical protein